MSGCDEIGAESVSEETTDSTLFDDDCLKIRRWWCFLLSSIFTFLAGLLVVLVWRLMACICCKTKPDLAAESKQKEAKGRNKQEFEGTFMTEAKDWAGELISGQTTTGRILVNIPNLLTHLKI